MANVTKQPVSYLTTRESELKKKYDTIYPYMMILESPYVEEEQKKQTQEKIESVLGKTTAGFSPLEIGDKFGDGTVTSDMVARHIRETIVAGRKQRRNTTNDKVVKGLENGKRDKLIMKGDVI